MIIIATILTILSVTTGQAAPEELIRATTDADRALEIQVRSLFFEPPITRTSIASVNTRSVTQHGARNVTLTTQDGYAISGLYFKRPAAKFNLLCINGYLFEDTPTKEWCAPIALMFPNANVLMFDWRGFGASDGYHGLLYKNSFGMHAWHDIQTCTDFIRADNQLPLASLGFCLGAGMLLHATKQAQAAGLATADILVLNGIFSRFNDVYERIHLTLKTPLSKLLFQTGVGRYIFSELVDGSLFQLNPIELIKDLTVPCLFQHYVADTFVPLKDMQGVVAAATGEKKVWLCELGQHVRLHRAVPAQFRDNITSFLWANQPQTSAAQAHAAIQTPCQ